MFNLKGVHQFEYCAVKKTQNNSAVSQKEFRSSTCDSTLESTWPHLRLDSDTDNMRRLLANHKLEFSIPYCASAVHIHIESRIFVLSLPPLLREPLPANTTTAIRNTTSTSQLFYMTATETTSDGPRSLGWWEWINLHAPKLLFIAVVIFFILLILLIVWRKRALYSKSMQQSVHNTEGSESCL